MAKKSYKQQCAERELIENTVKTAKAVLAGLRELGMGEEAVRDVRYQISHIQYIAGVESARSGAKLTAELLYRISNEIRHMA